MLRFLTYKFFSLVFNDSEIKSYYEWIVLQLFSWLGLKTCLVGVNWVVKSHTYYFLNSGLASGNMLNYRCFIEKVFLRMILDSNILSSLTEFWLFILQYYLRVHIFSNYVAISISLSQHNKTFKNCWSYYDFSLRRHFSSSQKHSKTSLEKINSINYFFRRFPQSR